MMAATLRGLHRWEVATPWVFDDPLALVLVGPTWRDLRSRLAEVFPESLLQLASTILVVRARYAEDRLASGAFDQYVLLGAGLDSFGWRRPDALAAGLRLFEVDHPASQAWKLARVAELGLPISDGHVFAAVDFEIETLSDGLEPMGFDWSRRTLFAWMAVTPYLSLEAIEGTLRSLAKCVPGSEIVLTYFMAPPLMEEVGRTFYGIFSELAVGIGEPVKALFTPDEMEDLVRRCGLDVTDHPALDDIKARYFAGRTDNLAPFTFEQYLTATVPG
jgi:methyltransferase (TIGR00027 family)